MTDIHPQTLSLSPETLAICQLEASAELPRWAQDAPFVSITRTSDELSIVCAEEKVPPDIKADRGWRSFKLHGPFPFSLVGILNSVTIPLAQANIGIFAISTYDTDHVLVKEHDLARAIQTLKDAGHTIA
ncbi:ACT domain-containing protein [Ktedonosporobacter rubrisoli]|uniref:ACT domain-containing protein n=1 Tax=Ktedonosporobacter rubrisoli TaxID=2509675 RepID=A0A4P6JJP7_KTERU|nr:ACT domain-containing protein [Ktedonosporobacter rubrisoli]QBD74866.1 ACT domain-containing protein [Ktedonosporobacter rubrisoli]